MKQKKHKQNLLTTVEIKFAKFILDAKRSMWS